VRKEINAFIYGLFEDQNTADYLMKVLASCLLGYNKYERYYVFTGAGGNGKGVITELIRVAFGNYYIPVNVSLFTKIQERLDMPVPALVESPNRRFMMSSEPETSERLQVSMLKKISGGDPMEERTLHSKHVWKFKPMFKPFFQANDIPKLSKVDTAIQRRMEVIKFPFNFVAHPTLPHERKGDPDVKNIKCVSDEWRDEFILMLTEIYATQLKNAKSIDLPESVKTSTNEYIDDNNPLKFWLNEKYDITKSDHDIISARELKASYMADNKVEKCDDRWFKQLLSFNSINHKRTGAGAVYTGLKRKAETSPFTMEE
jgi:putative DNA primase/helicase